MKSEALAKQLISSFSEQGATLATAESCTGGLIAKLLTDVAGSSAVFVGACVTYTNEAKKTLLGIEDSLLQQYTEVSHACAKAMAEGARTRLGASIALSTTGYAGPTGGTAEDPVGTVYLGISTAAATKSIRLSFPTADSRESIRASAAEKALTEALAALKTL